MKPTDDLKNEHEAITLMLEIMEKVAQELESGEKVDIKHLNSILEFLQVFADKCHHAKEEDLLFPAMRKAGISQTYRLIDTLLYEHSLVRSYINAVDMGTQKYDEGSSKAPSEIAGNFRNYSSLLSEHIKKEDGILYPLADQKLSVELQKDLERGFEKIESEVIGPGRHEQFHELLLKLKSKYIG